MNYPDLKKLRKIRLPLERNGISSTLIFFYFILFGIQFIAPEASAQHAYSIIHYDESILPQTSVGNIEQDEFGYLWMSTQYGIVRFDGQKVRVFTTDNLKGLSSNRIRVCAKGPDKRIYFVDENNFVIKVKSPDQFDVRPTTASTREQNLPLYSRESNNDFTYWNSQTKSDYRLFLDSLKLDLTSELLKFYAISQQEGYLFYLDLDHKIRLGYYSGSNYTCRMLSDSFKARNTFKLHNRVFSQVSLTQAYEFEKAQRGRTIPVVGLPSQYVRSFIEETPVLFSNSSGVFFYSSGKLYEYEMSDSVIVATLLFEDLPCQGVVNVMRERTTGDVLISTKSAGFYRIKRKLFGVVNLNRSPGESPETNTGLNNNIVYALSLWDKEHIFCTGYITPIAGKGVSRNFDPANKSVFNHYFLYPKDSSHIWLNFHDGIQSLDKRTGKYQRMAKIFEPKKVIELSDGSSIIVAAVNIVAIRNNQAIELFNTTANHFIAAEKITDDCLLLGTANGLYFFYPSQRRLQAIPYKESLKVRFIFKDKAGLIWLTTYGQGLFHFASNSLIRLPVDNAGYLAISHNISEDNSGNFWVSTNHGLFKLEYASLLALIRGESTKLYYTYFDKTDGFNTNEFNGGCSPSSIYQKETGLLFFPSMDGIVKFKPDSIKTVSSNSSIFLDEIVLNDTVYAYNNSGPQVFPKNTSSLRINFSSPYYGHGENVKFSYALSDAPDQWKDLEGNRSITLNNLPGGNYTLIIKKEEASNAPIETRFEFEIEKKFSETLAFKFLILAGIVAMVYLYFRARLLYLTKERTRLEKEVAARTADQLNLIDQLKINIARLTQLQVEMEQMIEHKENVMAVLIHDIKSPLHFLNTVSAHLDKSIDLNSSGKNKKIAKEIANSLNRLYLFTQDFAMWLSASHPGHIQTWANVDLEKIMDETLAVYRELIEEKSITIKLDIKIAWITGDAFMIKSIIRNLLDNAVKNTATGTIIISTGVGAKNQVCEIIITDQGKGMTEEETASLNNYFQSPQDTMLFATSGFGRKVIKDFLHKMDGEIYYQQNQPSGISVTVSLPLSNS